MKKVILLSVVIAFSVIFASCSKQQQPIPTDVTVIADTTIWVPDYRIHTAPRWNCNGNRLSQDKFIALDTSIKKPIFISLTRTKTILTDCAVNNEQSGITGTSWFWELLKWLLGIVAVGLVGWFLWWLFTQRPNRTAASPVAASATPTTPVAPARTVATTEEIVAVTNLVAAVSKGGGGTVRFSGLDIQINGVEAPLVHVENNGTTSHSGNITVHIGDRNSEDDRRIVHEAPAAEKKES